MDSPQPVPTSLEEINKCKRDKVHLSDGSIFYFDRGRKDDFCIHTCICDNGEYMRHFPTDEAVFDNLLNLADNYGKDKVWNDFNSVYNQTDDEVRKNKRDFSPAVIDSIRNMSHTYGDGAVQAERLYTWLYLGMISEYMYVSKQGRPSMLNKRIKQLGVKIALDKHDAKFAADDLRNHSVNFIKAKRVLYGLPAY